MKPVKQNKTKNPSQAKTENAQKHMESFSFWPALEGEWYTQWYSTRESGFSFS